MTRTPDSLFERRLSALLHEVLDDQAGPHSTWTDAPAARRVATGEGAQRWHVGNLRLLAIAAVLAVGGAAAAGAFLRNTPMPPLPMSTPSPSTPVQTDRPATNELIAYEQDNSVWVRPLEGEPTVIRGAADEVQSCPQFGRDGQLAFASQDAADSDPTTWQVNVIQLLDGSTYEPVSSLQIHVRPDETEACFEWSPDGERFAYAPLVGADVAFTIAEPGLSANLFGAGRDHLPVIPDYVRWKLDGSAVAFVYSVDPDGDGSGLYSEIWIAPIDGSDGAQSLLQTEPNEIINDVAWSPDGEAIAYRSTRFSAGVPTGASVSVLAIGPDGQRLQLDQLNDPDLGAGPAWSPDGSRLAWVLGGDLRVGAPDGSGWRGLPPMSSDELGLVFAWEPLIWSADGNQLLAGQVRAVGSDVEFSVVMYDVDSQAQPTAVLPWREGGYGRVSWQVLGE